MGKKFMLPIRVLMSLRLQKLLIKRQNYDLLKFDSNDFDPILYKRNLSGPKENVLIAISFKIPVENYL